MSLRDEILAGGFDLQNRDDGAIAAALSIGRTTLTPHPIGFGTLLTTLGPEEGSQVLDALEAANQSGPLKWAWTLLERGELDVSVQATRIQIDALTGTIFTPEQATKIKALAETPVTISAYEVTKAMEGYEHGD